MCPGFPAILAAVIIPLFLSFIDGGGDLDERTVSDLNRAPSSCVTLFLCGDVMTGRGIDQILPDNVDPQIYEPWIKDARDYVRLAERAFRNYPHPGKCRYQLCGGGSDI